MTTRSRRASSLRRRPRTPRPWRRRCCGTAPWGNANLQQPAFLAVSGHQPWVVRNQTSGRHARAGQPCHYKVLFLRLGGRATLHADVRGLSGCSVLYCKSRRQPVQLYGVPWNSNDSLWATSSSIMSCAQVNWGPFPGKYLSTAVGTSRSYIQVHAALCRFRF